MMIVSIFPSMALSTDKRNAGIRCFSEKEFKGRKELFYLTMHSHVLFMVIWSHTYGKGHLR